MVERHLGYRLDLTKGEYQLPAATEQRIARMAKQILRSAARNQRWGGALWVAQFAGLAISTRRQRFV